jgi:cysteine desulfurase/selenocysteine lyase
MPTHAFFSPETVTRARSLFPHTLQGKIHLNHAGTSPLSTRVLGAMQRYLHERSEGQLDTYRDDLPMVAELRAYITQMIHAESPGRIALTPNTSEAINIVADGIDWKPGDRIVVGHIEFPANVWPFLNLKQFGVEIDFIHSTDGRVTLEQIAHAIQPRTRLVALSAVQFLSGYRADLAAIGSLCRSKGIIFAVDGAQAVGAIAFDVQAQNIDALSAGGQKWQMSPHGTGFLYLTPALQAQIRQRNLGWLSVADPWDFHNYTQEIDATARRYEGGSLIMPSLWGMHAALGTLLEFGPPAIESHILSITHVLMDGFRSIKGVSLFTPASDADRAGIVTIDLPRGTNVADVVQQLLQRKITLAPHEGKLRFSPHFYNTPAEMETTVEALRDILRA